MHFYNLTLMTEVVEVETPMFFLMKTIYNVLHKTLSTTNMSDDEMK